MYDLAIVGGGPAGLAAAIHGCGRGKSVLLVTNEPTASPLCKAERVENYPGMPGTSGMQMVSVMVKQAAELGAEIRTGRVLNIMPMGQTNYLSIGSDMAQANAVILATGVSRTEKLPGEAALLGRGVSYCATCDGMLYRGKDVVVAGTAHDWKKEADFLRGIGCRVTEVPLAGMRISGEKNVTAVESEGRIIPCDGVFLLRATVAPTDLVPGLEMNGGYIGVDRYMRTSVKGIYAAGDCTGLPLQIAKAVGEGQMAAYTAIEEMK